MDADEVADAFRAANDKLRQGWLAGGGRTAYPFLCECRERRCTGVVFLPLDRYDEIRGHPAWFVVLPGHRLGEVVEEADGHAVVRSRAASGRG